MMNRPFPRILLAAPGSGCGKTTLALALLEALRQQGILSASFKCGPDYIDPMFHERVLGSTCRNLDLHLLDERTLRRLFCQNAGDAQLSVIEGVMGYYDGIASSTQASSYAVAGVLEAPVILVISCRGKAASMAAEIGGFLHFRPDSGIRGVFLNHLSPALYGEMKALIEREWPLKVLGCLPQIPECSIESRHLGLVTAPEVEGLRSKIARLGAELLQTLDIEGLLSIAGEAPALSPEDFAAPEPGERFPVRLGVARDRAFCFYYPDSLELLAQMGAELVPFSPLHDRSLPPALDGLILGGGYPELYAPMLSENRTLLEEIRDAVLGGMPCVAECGGFMLLHRTLEDSSGRSYPMCGVWDAHAYPAGKLRRFGYETLTAREDNLLLREGERVPAHEFHYWDSTFPGISLLAQKPGRDTRWETGVCGKNLFAGFSHLHFCSEPRMAVRFLGRCAAYRENREAAGVRSGSV